MSLITDFESGSTAGWSGSTFAFDVNTTNPYQGSYSGEVVGFATAAYRTLTLDSTTVGQGDSFEGWFSVNASPYFSAGLYWGTSEEGYSFGFDGSAGFSIQRWDTSSSGSIIAQENHSYSTNTYYRFEVDHNADGTIAGTVYDVSGTEIVALSATDTTYTGGNIGIKLAAGTDENVYADNLALSVSGPTTESASVQSDSLVASAQSPSVSISGEPQSATASVALGTVGALSPAASTPTVSTGDVTRGLVSRWHFDGNLTDSEGTNDGSGSVSYTAGEIDQGVLFNGTNLVEVADDPTLDASEFTVGFRAYPVSTSSGTNSIHTYAGRDSGYTDRMFWIVQWDGIWQARVGSNAVTVQGPAVQTGAFVHVGLTYDGSTFTLYIDGVPVGSNTEPTLGGAAASMTFGAESAVSRHVPSGTIIDDGRFHNVALTDSEMVDVAAYDGSSTPPPATQAVIPTTASMTGAASAPSAVPGAATAAPLTASATSTAHGSSASAGAVSASVGASSGVLTPTTISAAPGGVAAAVDGGSVTAAPAGVSAIPGPVGATTALATASATGLGVSAVYVAPDARTATLAASPGLVATPVGPGAVPGSASAVAESVSGFVSGENVVVTTGVSAALTTADGVVSSVGPGAVAGPVSASMVESALVGSGVEFSASSAIAVGVDSGTAVFLGPSPGVVAGVAAVSVLVGNLSGTARTVDVSTVAEVVADAVVASVIAPEAAVLPAPIAASMGTTSASVSAPMFTVQAIREVLGRSETGWRGFLSDETGRRGFLSDETGRTYFDMDNE